MNQTLDVSVVTAQVRITPVLGRISVQGARLIEAPSRNNSTRWLFDVDGSSKTPIVVQLLDPRSGLPVKPDLVSGSLLPRSAMFFEACPFLDTLDDGKLVLIHATDAVCRYRVCVDTMHTATR